MKKPNFTIRTQNNRSKGFGDTVEKFTKAYWNKKSCRHNFKR